MPCGHTLASVCPACAERAKNLRAAQCREGWHLDREPDLEPDPATDDQEWWIENRAEVQARRDRPRRSARTPRTWTSCSPNWMRKSTGQGCAATSTPPDLASAPVDQAAARRTAAAAPQSGSADGRQDLHDAGRQDVPAVAVPHPHLPVLRASVNSDGTPADPDRYDYTAAARDALHFAALFDRFIQNLRRYCGYDLQYFAAIEPQRRLAPHVHMALRGTVSRRELREVIAATYHQVWWPSTTAVRFDGDHLPVWDEAQRNLPGPGNRRGAAHLGPGAGRDRRHG